MPNPPDSTTADASASLPSASPPNPGLVEVRSTETMGKGLFAVRAIPRGTRIVEEAPIIALPVRPGPADLFPAFCDALPHLTARERSVIDNLHILDAYASIDIPMLWDKGLQDAATRFYRFLSNALIMTEDDEIVVFELVSRINHSCIPNAYVTYNDTIKRVTVHAIRDIRAGEQITRYYLPDIYLVAGQRVPLLREFEISCACPGCTADAGRETLRWLAFNLTRYVAMYFLRRAQGLEDEDEFWNAIKFREKADNVVELLQQAGLEGMELCQGYRSCAKVCLVSGDIEAARDYAVRELEVERRLIGTETERLRAEMKGAEYWLAHLEEKLRAAGLA